MPKTTTKPKSAAKWRDWRPTEQQAEPKRACSVAGCKTTPRRVRESRTPAGNVRRHVYCQKHADALETE